MMLVGVATIFVPAPVHLLAASVCPGLLDARYRVYHAFYNNIEVGMTREQIPEQMNNQDSTGCPASYG